MPLIQYLPNISPYSVVKAAGIIVALVSSYLLVNAMFSTGIIVMILKMPLSIVLKNRCVIFV